MLRKWSLSIFLVVIAIWACSWTISNQLDIYGNAFRFVLCALTSIAALNFPKSAENCKDVFDCRWKKTLIFIVCLSAAFSFSESAYIVSAEQT